MADITGGLFGYVTRGLGLPELGISERLGGNTGSLNKSSGVSSVTTTPTATGGSANTGSTGGGGGSKNTSTSTKTSSASASADQAVKNAQKSAQDQKDQEAEQRAAYEKQMKEGISKAYDPIFSELDRQLGQIPSQQQQYEAQLGTLADQQKQGAEADRIRNIGQLEESKGAEFKQSKDSLRNLEDDIRNNLKAYQFYFGTRGAGDSSATGLASEAIATGGLKARSNILAVRDEGLNAIELKKADVNNLATEQSRKIDEWKSNKVFETVQFFQNKVDELSKAKANASAEKQNAINNLIQNTQADFVGRLRQIDDSVSNFKTSVDTWKVQRQAELEDFATKLATSASYSSASPDKISVIRDKFGDSYAFNQSSGSVTRLTGTEGSGNGNPLQGLTGYLSTLFNGEEETPASATEL